MRNALQSRIPACDGFSCPRTIGKPCNRCGDRGPKTVAPVVTPVAPVTPVPSPPLPWDPTQPAAKTPRVEDAISDLDIDLYDELPPLSANEVGLADAIPLIDFHEAPPALPWTLDDAVALCRKIEKIAPEYGAHVALTGGTLYKDGPRKDVDLLFYRIRQVKEIDRPRLIRALQRIGIEISKRHGWVQKAFYEGKPIDLFFPDHIDGERDEAGEYA